MFEGLRKKLGDVVKSFAKKEVAKEEEEEELAEEVEGGAAPEQREEAAKPDENGGGGVAAHVEEQPADKRPIARAGKGVAVDRRDEKAASGTAAPGVKLSVKTRIKSLLMRTVKLGDSDIDGFIDDLRISMLESDTAYDTTEEFLGRMRERLKDGKFDTGNIGSSINAMARDSLLGVLKKGTWEFDLDKTVGAKVAAGERPVKILFLGPNGTGKTTTIAKLAHRFKLGGLSCVMSASDTFRAAAIEQTEHHARMIGVPVIKSGYGADPASIAFDAIAYAKAHGADVVLIDSAGRQETNRNLISEVQKMVRVAKPDVIIFVGESTTGNAMATQIAEFAKYIKVDGIILTKLDCDAKGGSAISISDVTGVPILFFGVGESYDALVKYSPEFVVNNIFGGNN